MGVSYFHYIKTKLDLDEFEECELFYDKLLSVCYDED